MTGLHPACAQSAPETGASSMQLLDTPSVSLGKIHCYEVQRVSFRFKNTGAAPASILLFLPTCHCVSGSADQARARPGEETTVTLAFDPATVSGSFQLGLWVHFDDPAKTRVLLSVSGEVIPAFTGVPFEPLVLRSLDSNAVWTNRFTFTATEAGFRLGAPQIETHAQLRTAVTLATNASDTSAYDLTCVIAPLAPGRHKTSVTLPVEGGSNVPPVRIAFQVRAGQALAASPEQVSLYASDATVTRQFLLRTDEAAVNAEALTWEPHLAGITVKVRPAKRSANLLATVQFSPEALKRLLAEKEPSLLFRYPGHSPAAVRLVAAEGSAPEPSDQ